MNTIIDTKVLIVEDEETLRHAVTRLLERRGFSVLEACEGRTAIDILRSNGSHIGVVLLDIRLPDLDGGDVFANMCLINPAVKVILTTACHREIPAGERRPWGYLRKPYHIDALANLLNNALAA
jgi:two-component system, cell cycle sensor histidine kinase and response regulator CckA